MDALPALAASPLPWLVLTMLAYTLTLALYRRSGAHPLLIPPLTATALVVAVLLATGTPYATYRAGTGLLSFLIGPAMLGPLAGASSVHAALWVLPAFAALAGILGVIAIRLTRLGSRTASTVPG